MKSTWRVLNEIMNRKTQKNRLPSTFKIDNREISNPKEIANRFCEYFTNIGPNLAILFKNQYGFRKGHSISFALLHLFEKILSAIDRREHTVGIFLDLSKAFDTVNFISLFEKLEHYGIRGIALNWIKDYFSRRSQFVQFNEHCSNYYSIKCGVPQVSILGPLLFLLYIDDLSNVSNILDIILFADDTNIFFSHRDQNYLVETIDSEMNKLTEWFKCNKLSLNTKKSSFMIFQPRQKRKTLDFSITLNSTHINRVKEVVFLGVVLDEHVTWKPHISRITKKVSKAIGLLCKSRFYISKFSLRTLYYSLVYPYLYYRTIAWGSTYPSNLNRLVILQKRVIRIINKDTFDAHTDPIFRDLKLLRLDQIYLYQLGKFMYLYRTGSLSKYFHNYFPMTNEVHSYNTTRAKSYYIPLCRTNIWQFSIKYKGPKFCNTLSFDISNCSTVSTFNSKLRNYLLCHT